MRFINGTRLDDRIIRTDWDAGFKEGRQYGRGKSGGQVSGKAQHEITMITIIITFIFQKRFFANNITQIKQNVIIEVQKRRLFSCFQYYYFYNNTAFQYLNLT